MSCFNCKHGQKIQFFDREKKRLDFYVNNAMCSNIKKLNNLLEQSGESQILYPSLIDNAKDTCTYWEDKNDE